MNHYFIITYKLFKLQGTRPSCQAFGRPLPTFRSVQSSRYYLTRLLQHICKGGQATAEAGARLE